MENLLPLASKIKCFKTKDCVSSKSARLILPWNFAVPLVFKHDLAVVYFHVFVLHHFLMWEMAFATIHYIQPVYTSTWTPQTYCQFTLIACEQRDEFEWYVLYNKCTILLFEMPACLHIFVSCLNFLWSPLMRNVWERHHIQVAISWMSTKLLNAWRTWLRIHISTCCDFQLGWMIAWCLDPSGDYHGRDWAIKPSVHGIQENLFIKKLRVLRRASFVSISAGWAKS